MPYRISHRGSKWCVTKLDGTVVKCHPSKTKAMKHLAALSINVTKREK